MGVGFSELEKREQKREQRRELLSWLFVGNRREGVAIFGEKKKQEKESEQGDSKKGKKWRARKERKRGKELCGS